MSGRGGLAAKKFKQKQHSAYGATPGESRKRRRRLTVTMSENSKQDARSKSSSDWTSVASRSSISKGQNEDPLHSPLPSLIVSGTDDGNGPPPSLQSTVSIASATFADNPSLHSQSSGMSGFSPNHQYSPSASSCESLQFPTTIEEDPTIGRERAEPFTHNPAHRTGRGGLGNPSKMIEKSEKFKDETLFPQTARIVKQNEERCKDKEVVLLVQSHEEMSLISVSGRGGVGNIDATKKRLRSLGHPIDGAKKGTSHIALGSPASSVHDLRDDRRLRLRRSPPPASPNHSDDAVQQQPQTTRRKRKPFGKMKKAWRAVYGSSKRSAKPERVEVEVVQEDTSDHDDANARCDASESDVDITERFNQTLDISCDNYAERTPSRSRSSTGEKVQRDDTPPQSALPRTPSDDTDDIFYRHNSLSPSVASSLPTFDRVKYVDPTIRMSLQTISEVTTISSFRDSQDYSTTFAGLTVRGRESYIYAEGDELEEEDFVDPFMSPVRRASPMTPDHEVQ